MIMLNALVAQIIYHEIFLGPSNVMLRERCTWHIHQFNFFQVGTAVLSGVTTSTLGAVHYSQVYFMRCEVI